MRFISDVTLNTVTEKFTLSLPLFQPHYTSEINPYDFKYCLDVKRLEDQKYGKETHVTVGVLRNNNYLVTSGDPRCNQFHITLSLCSHGRLIKNKCIYWRTNVRVIPVFCSSLLMTWSCRTRPFFKLNRLIWRSNRPIIFQFAKKNKWRQFTCKYSPLRLRAAHQAPFPFDPAVRCNRAWCGS